MIEERTRTQEVARLAERYNPLARFEVESRDVEYRHDGARSWLTRVYQPQGEGPFPAVIEIHGGAWGANDRLQNEPANQDLASSGVVVAAIDFRQSTDAPYPAALEDINYATRWLKVHAGEFNASSAALGLVGYSSGGHLAILSAMRPRDSRYAALPLAEAPDLDGRVDYVIAGWPVIDPHARYLHARNLGRQNLVTAGERMFGDEAGMREANPQQLLERGEEPEALPPTLLLLGADDDILPPRVGEKFVTEYARAGGVIELALYPGAGHGFMRDPGDNGVRAMALLKSFIGRQLTILAAE